MYIDITEAAAVEAPRPGETAVGDTTPLVLVVDRTAGLYRARLVDIDDRVLEQFTMAEVIGDLVAAADAALTALEIKGYTKTAPFTSHGGYATAPMTARRDPEAAAEECASNAVAGRLAQILAGLEELGDVLADAGADSGLIDDYTTVELRHCLGRREGSVAERMRRLAAIDDVLGGEMTATEDGTGAVHYRATKEFADGAVIYQAFTIVDPGELEDAAAALAEALADQDQDQDEDGDDDGDPTAPMPVLYTVDHDPETTTRVAAAFADHGIRVRHTVAATPTGAPVITALADDRGEWGVRLTDGDDAHAYPPLGAYPTVEDYVGALARTLLRQVPRPHDAGPDDCGRDAEIAIRGIHPDGRVITCYTTRSHAERVRLFQAWRGFTTVELSALPDDEHLCGETETHIETEATR